nr:type VI secretion system baseplate subunit TssF [Deltaproteobacteria bacterium]
SMDDSILNYYERELTYIREMGAEFAKKYPKIAGRLQLEPDKCEDPHTERLIEAFALICARIHKKIDDDFPEITESLLSIIYPHYISPIPSMSIVRFEPIKKAIPPGGYRIEKNTAVYSKPIGGTACLFSTGYPTTIWPVEVISAGLQDVTKPIQGAQQAIGIQLKTFNKAAVSEIGGESLRFYLNGPHQHIFHLYELLFNHVCHVELIAKNKQGKPIEIPLGPSDIVPVGFESDEGLLPSLKRSFPGYRMLFEYFCFPEKFLFFSIKGLERLRKFSLGEELEINLYLNRSAKPDLVINEDTFSLNTTAVINLFNHVAEPIRIDQHKSEYQVIPDVRRRNGTELFSIEKVIAVSPSAQDSTIEYRPFYSIRHHLEEEEPSKRVFWHMQRRESGKKGDSGTEVFLSFTDLDFSPTGPASDIVTVHTLCTNRDLPSRLPFGDSSGDFTLEAAAPVERITSLIKPTPTRRPSLGGHLQWRLISHLSLNYMSIVQGGEDALREILKLYDFYNSPSTRQQITGIVSLNSRHVTKRMGQSFCRGVRVAIEFDEEKYVGAGLYLFASVLERFIAQYVSVNSFTQLEARTVQKKEAIKVWPPRSGNQSLI